MDEFEELVYAAAERFPDRGFVQRAVALLRGGDRRGAARQLIRSRAVRGAFPRLGVLHEAEERWAAYADGSPRRAALDGSRRIVDAAEELLSAQEELDASQRELRQLRGGLGK